jgi:hypothetical protein
MVDASWFENERTRSADIRSLESGSLVGETAIIADADSAARN